MATLEQFLPEIQPHLPGCSQEIVLNEIRNACIRFCTDTWIIRENLIPQDITEDVDTYTLSPSAENAVVGIVSFLYDERELTPGRTEEELDIIDQGWRTSDPGDATYITSPTPGTVLLNRKPDETIVDGLVVRVATKPSIDAENVNDMLYQEWMEAIKYGTLQKLYEIPGKGWSDAKQSFWYAKNFNFQIQRGKARAVMGNMRKSTTAKMRTWTT